MSIETAGFPSGQTMYLAPAITTATPSPSPQRCPPFSPQYAPGRIYCHLVGLKETGRCYCLRCEGSSGRRRSAGVNHDGQSRNTAFYLFGCVRNMLWYLACSFLAVSRHVTKRYMDPAQRNIALYIALVFRDMHLTSIFPICPPYNDKRYTGPPIMSAYRSEPCLAVSVTCNL
jgi:hypothetical protein